MHTPANFAAPVVAGGSAERVLTCKSVRELRNIIAECNRAGKRWILLGSGSNCIFLDPVFRGTVIFNEMRSCSVVNASVISNDGRSIGMLCEQHQGRFTSATDTPQTVSTLRLGSGCSLAQLAVTTANKGWAGLEEFCGIPGTVGGAIRCNAGSNGREMCDAIQQVHFLDIKTLQEFSCRKESLQWSYRDLKAPGIITSVTVDLWADGQASSRVRTYLARRRLTQPLHKPSAGCIFKNPAGGPSAGALLDMSGLKGHRIGGATVSQKHANFFLNEDMTATPADFMQLIAHARERVWQDHGVMLDLEIRIIQNQDCSR